MTRLEWGQPGERLYQTGIDRGVLYVPDSGVASWRGLTSVEESPSSETKAYYQDGIKYLEEQTIGDFTTKLKAFTYPDLVDEVVGVIEDAPGVLVYDQPQKAFHLSYRTLVGNDLDGTDHGYKVHLLWNLRATPDASDFSTLSESVSPIEFGWSLTSVPVSTPGYRAITHLTIDSTKTDPADLAALEDILYGTAATVPRMPTPTEVLALF
jgi:hypothetical protein